MGYIEKFNDIIKVRDLLIKINIEEYYHEQDEMYFCFRIISSPSSTLCITDFIQIRFRKSGQIPMGVKNRLMDMEDYSYDIT